MKLSSSLLSKLIPIIKGASTVKRSATPYSIQQGWKLNVRVIPPRWDGYYRTRYGSFKGMVEALYVPRFYIHNPPDVLRQHSHWVCFTMLTHGWYSAHFSTLPRDVDSGIMAIERIIHEAFQLYKKTA